MRIGVVIPTLEEEAVIERTLRALIARGTPAMVVVSDCGSRDRTVSLARRFDGVAVISDPARHSRASAMNAGAIHALRQCPGLDALWFLHADSMPPGEWGRSIAEALEDDCIVAGAFDVRWDHDGVPWHQRLTLAFFRALNRARFRLTRTYFGDQGIFVRREAFERIGGFPEVSLMEDVIACRRLKRLGRLRLADGAVRTSPRRFLRHGVCRQVAIDTWLLLAERLGFRPSRLHAWYNHRKA